MSQVCHVCYFLPLCLSAFVVNFPFSLLRASRRSGSFERLLKLTTKAQSHKDLRSRVAKECLRCVTFATSFLCVLVPLWLTSRFHSYVRAVGQVLSAVDDDRLSACESLIDFNAIAEITPHRDRLRQDAAVVKDKNDALSVTLLNRGLGNRDARAFGVCAGH